MPIKKILLSLVGLSLLIFMVTFFVTTTKAAQAEIRINAGGSAFTDSNGKAWQADQYFNTGSAFSTTAAISGTTDDPIYQSERWDDTTVPELEYTVPVENGTYQVKLHFAEIFYTTGGSRVFDVNVEGNLALDNVDIAGEVGPNAALVKTIDNVTVSDGNINIQLVHGTENPKISGIEIIPAGEGAHTAHAVAGPDQTVSDLDANGSQAVTLNASDSHTHIFNGTLTSYVWKEGTTQLATGVNPTVTLPVGTHTITLTVTDSAGNTNSDDVIINVVAQTQPKLVGYYFNFAGTNLTLMPQMNGVKPDIAQYELNLNTAPVSTNFRGTGLNTNFSARYYGLIKIDTAGTYGFTLESNDGSKLYIDGQLVIDHDGAHGFTKKSGTKTLTTGYHEVTLDYFQGAATMGLNFYWKLPGTTTDVIVPTSALFHNHGTVLPIINSITPANGSMAGGEKITISGFGFVQNTSQITVNFGGTVLTGSQITKVNENTLEVNAPAGSGSALVSVTTPNGTTKNKTYVYSTTAPNPIKFIKGTLITGVSGLDGPTSIAIGPDEKIYVGTMTGEVWKLTVDDNNVVTSSFKSTKIATSETTPRTILGIAFNPLDDPANPKVYVSHAQIYHGGSGKYSGKVSTLTGANLDVKADVVTGLPVSDHDHAINGLEFGQGGELYINVGGNTNAGVPAPAMGNLPEYKFSAGTMIAHIERPNFNGNITYDANNNQTGGFDVEVFAAGQRNPFDLTLHSNGKLYGTDNGPNFTYGPSSTGCNTQGAEPETDDELNLLESGKYYGHPNRFRGVTDPRQCIFHPATESGNAEYTAPLTTLPRSSDGITEYTANTFGGQLRGNLLIGKWGGPITNVKLNTAGTAVADKTTLTPDGGLDVVVNKKGTIFVVQNQEDQIIYHKADEPAPSTTQAIGVFPTRGPLNGSRTMSISGYNFGAASTVKVGSANCPVVSVTATLIKCNVPGASTAGFVDVEVTNGTQVSTMTKAYGYMTASSSNQDTGKWFTKAVAPASLGEVTSAVVGNYVYLFAGNTNKTYRYNPATNTWTTMADQTVVPVRHHVTAQVINGKIYMFGGLGATDSYDLAVYDPATNTWTKKAPLTKNGVLFGLGSPASAAINGKLYVAGGIKDNATINTTFEYDPATDTWTEKATMPFGRNHAAGGAVNGKFYVFGGRTGGNVVSNGTNTVQAYDPATNTWTDLTGTAPLPTARGGMGNAPELNGELLVIGGEGNNAPANGVFPQVEAFNPTTNSWRSLANLTTPRHGIYPVTLNNRVYVIAGGTQAGTSQSNINEMYDPTGVGTIPTLSTVRINAGGNAYTDSTSKVWGADEHFNTGNTFTATGDITGTTDDTLYLTERWDDAVAPELQYGVPVVNGTYKVVLHFAETLYDTAGSRVFDVSTENNLVLDNFDILTVGPKNSAVTRTINNVVVTDGTLNILFAHVTENPKVNAIEILPDDGVGNPSPTPTPTGTPTPSPTGTPTVTPTPATGSTVRLNVGGGALTDSAGKQWAADQYFNIGNVYTVTSDILGTTDDALYQNERWDGPTAPEMEYTIPVTNGNYQVKLHFVELLYTTVGKRIFDVSIEGALKLDNFDIISQVPKNTPTVKTFDNINVTDGNIKVSFGHVTENPNINAIEIVPMP